MTRIQEEVKKTDNALMKQKTQKKDFVGGAKNDLGPRRMTLGAVLLQQKLALAIVKRTYEQIKNQLNADDEIHRKIMQDIGFDIYIGIKTRERTLNYYSKHVAEIKHFRYYGVYERLENNAMNWTGFPKVANFLIDTRNFLASTFGEEQANQIIRNAPLDWNEFPAGKAINFNV